MQDVVAVGINPLTGKAQGNKRVTTSSNNTESDPLLGGFFIGDYFEAALYGNRFFVHYNANYRKVPLLGAFFGGAAEGNPAVNQQDNYLTITALN
jgi:hypothetical protein